jgi:hypothetical protein
MKVFLNVVENFRNLYQLLKGKALHSILHLIYAEALNVL